MSNTNKKTLGIIGGMGPAATADLYTKIISHTPATKDQDHLHVIIDADAEIPDRTSYILNVAEYRDAESKPTNSQTNTLSKTPTATSSQALAANSPLPHLMKSVHRLEEAGADFIVMACITAHVFADEITASIDVPFFGIPEIAAKTLKQKRADKVVILSTKGTAYSRIFDEPLNRLNIKFEYAAQNHGKLMTELIYSLVKGGNPEMADELYAKAKTMLAQYKQKGFNHFLLACTELPIAFKMLGLIDETFTDCTEELAKFCVEYGF